MAFAASYKRFAITLSAIVISSVLFWFGNGLNPWWPLLWFAPLPILVVSLRSQWWAASLAAILTLLLGGLNLWHYFRLLGAPPAVWVAAFGTAALAFAASVLIFRRLVLSGSIWTALVGFPAVWVAFEFIRNLSSVHGTGGSLAYSQLRFLPFLQLASITGPWGMSFFLMLFPAALAIGFHLRSSAPKQARCIMITSLSVIALILILGGIRLAIAPTQPQIRIGLVTSDAPENAGIVAEGAATERLFHDYAKKAEELANSGAQVIVLPEKLGVVVDPDSSTTDALFQSVANKTKATIVVGLLHVSPPEKYNQARVYAPEAAVLSYDKHHMLPPFESSLKPGTSLTTMSRPSGVWGVAICKDMDFTPLLREYGNQGVALMLVPGWDFNIDRAWHGHIAVMRAVEDGFTLVRAAKNGYLTVSDNRGRIISEARSDSAPYTTLLANVPVVHSRTIYLMLGDWFGWLAIAICLMSITRLIRSREKLALQAVTREEQVKT